MCHDFTWNFRSIYFATIGAYKPVLEAIDNRDFKLIAILGLGVVVGLLSFSKVLKWLFSNYKNYTLAVLTGFILGSLNKIWPWKKTITVLVDESKLIVPFSKISELGTLSVYQQQINNFDSYKVINEVSVLPIQYSSINQYIDNQFIYALLLMGIGFAVILLLEKIANTSNVS